MFNRHRLGPTNKLDCPHAMGTNAFSPQRAKSFRHFLLLPSPPVVYHGCKPTNLRLSLGAGAAQFQASRLRVRSHAGACSSPAERTTREYVQRSNCPTQAKRRLEWATGAQRTGKRYAGRCAEVVEARSIATFDWRCGAFLAKAVLRFQHSKLSAVCGKAALHSSQSGDGWVVRTSGGLGVEQFPPLRNRLCGTGRDRVGMDGTKT